MPELFCRTCKKIVKNFEVIKYSDLTGWCSLECFRTEGKRIEEELAKRDQYVKLKTLRSGF